MTTADDLNKSLIFEINQQKLHFHKTKNVLQFTHHLYLHDIFPCFLLKKGFEYVKCFNFFLVIKEKWERDRKRREKKNKEIFEIWIPKQYLWGQLGVEDKLYTRYDEQFRTWMSISMSQEQAPDFPTVTQAFISTVLSARVGSAPEELVVNKI